MSDNKIDSNLTAKDVSELLNESNLSYIANNSSNVVVERNVQQQNSEGNEFNATNNMVINFVTGGLYISGKDSWLSLDMSANQAAWTFGRGSILNIFSSVKVITRSGTVLSYIEGVNLLQYYQSKYEQSREWLNREAYGLMGQQSLDRVGPGQSGAPAYPAIDTKIKGTVNLANVYDTYNIPLSYLSPFFASPVLIPSAIARGMRIEIGLAAVDIALQSGSVDETVPPSAYTVKNVVANVDCYRLANNAVLRLNEMATSDESLVYEYFDWVSSFTNKPAGVSNVAFEVRSSNAMANSAFAVIRKPPSNDHAYNLSINTDSFLAKPIGASDTLQFRIGSSIYLPQTVIQGPSQWYANTLYTNGQVCSLDTKAVTYDEYVGAGLVADNSIALQSGGLGIATCAIDRYWLSQSGLTLNNSTTLLFSCNLTDDTAAYINVFLKHTKRAKCFQDSVNVLT